LPKLTQPKTGGRVELNERYLKLTTRGELATDKELNLGDDLGVVVTVERIEQRDNQDGTYDLIYKCSLLSDVPTQEDQAEA
jgi:hypothetical protein